MSSLKVAVFGLGVMGKHHARIYNQLPESELVGVCDADEGLASSIATQYNCEFMTDIDSFLDTHKVDAVSITTPTSTHYEIAKKVIKKGCHVLIEKPITDSYKTGEELYAMAAEAGLTLMVGHVERFNPVILKLKELLDAGEIGDIISMTAKRVGIYPNRIRDANVLIDLAVHDIDILNDFMGQEPEEVIGNAGSALLENREDYAELFLKYGKRSGYIQVNWITPARIRTLSVTGTKAYVDVDYIQQKLTLTKSSYTKENQGQDATIQFENTEPVEVEIEKSEPLVNELSHFIESIHKKDKPIVDGHRACAALRIAQSI